MKTINNFIAGVLRRLKKPAGLTLNWVKDLNSVKIIALIVINCFLLTSVYGQAAAAVIDNVKAAQNFKQMFEDFNLPYSYGKITSANFAGSDAVVINIQDLHSHPDVQKNISKIIDLFDRKYGVNTVYLEGAYGQVDTSWLSVSDRDLRETILESMLNSGRLTGAEYYSVISGRPKVIKGLENEKEYLGNLQRFGKILEFQDEITLIINSMSQDIDKLKETYYNRQQKKIEELSKEYYDGKVEAKKYFALIYKYTDRLGIDIYKYENIDAYKSLLANERNLDYKRISFELNALISSLKDLLPYQAYKLIVDNTANFTEIDKLYVYLIKFAREHNINLEVNFPNLNRFLDYVDLSQKINPLELIKEEKKLIDEINEKFSADPGERNVVFMVSFQRYLKDFMSSKITSDDYRYYEENKEEFRNLWVRYIDNKKIELLDEYRKVAEEFYEVNIARNKYFFDNIEGLEAIETLSGVNTDGDAAEQVIKSLKDAKNIYVIVTGGFHTDGVAEYLTERGVSSLTVTPNVAGGVKAAEETYYRIAKEQSETLFNALAALNLTQFVEKSQADSVKQYKAVAESIINSGEITPEDIKNINKFLNAMLKDNNDSAIVSIEYNGENDIKLSIDKEVLSYDAAVKQFIPSASETGRYKSIQSENPILIASSVALGASIVMIGLGFLTVLPLLPIVGIFGGIGALSISFLSLSAANKLKMQKAKNELAKNSMAETGERRPDYRIFLKILENISLDSRKKLIPLMLKNGDSLSSVDLSIITEAAGVQTEIERINSEITKISEELESANLVRNERREKNNRKAELGERKSRLEAELQKLESRLSAEIYDRVGDNDIAMFFDGGAVHLNYDILSKLFFDGDRVKNPSLLETFIKHEIRHANFGKKGLSKFIRDRNIGWLEELLVSLGDLRSLIGAYASNIALKIKIKRKIDELKSTEDDKTFVEQLIGVPVHLTEGLTAEEQAELKKPDLSGLQKAQLVRAVTVLGKDFVTFFITKQMDKYGPAALNSIQTINQIIAAAEMVEGGIIELGTGAGKTDAFQLATEKLLSMGKNILFLTNTEDLAKRDIRGIFEDIYKNQKQMIKLGVLKDGEPLQFGFVHESDDSKTILYSWAGNGVEEKVADKRAVYGTARAVAGSSAAALVWDIERDAWAKESEKTITQGRKKWVLLLDEAHRLLLQEANNTFSTSYGQRRDALKNAMQQEIAHNVARAFVEGQDYKVEGSKITIFDKAKRKAIRQYRENGGIGAEADILARISNSLTAKHYKLGSDYKVMIDHTPEGDYVKVALLDKTTKETKGSVKLSNNLHYALELAVKDRIDAGESGYAEFKGKEIAYSSETMQSTSMTLNVFLSESEVIESWAGATGTADAHAMEAYYGKRIISLGSEGGANPIQVASHMTADEAAQEAKLMNAAERINNMDGKGVLSKTLTLVRAKSTVKAADFAKKLSEQYGKERVYTITDADDLSAIDENLIRKYADMLGETEANATEADKEKAAREKAEFLEKIKDWKIVVEDGQNKLKPNPKSATIEDIVQILAAAAPGMFIVGTNLIATGINAKPMGEVKRMISINTVFDKDHFVEEQNKNRVGRNKSIGLYINIFALSDIDKEEMTQDDRDVLESKLKQKHRSISGARAEQRVVNMTAGVAGIGDAERDFIKSFMNETDNMYNDFAIDRQGKVSSYGKSDAIMTSINNIKDSYTSGELAGNLQLQRYGQDFWDLIKEFAQVRESYNTDEWIGLLFGMSKERFKSEYSLSNERVEELRTALEASLDESWLEFSSALSDANYNMGNIFKNEFFQAFFQFGEVEQDTEKAALLAGLKDDFAFKIQQRAFDKIRKINNENIARLTAGLNSIDALREKVILKYADEIMRNSNAAKKAFDKLSDREKELEKEKARKEAEAELNDFAVLRSIAVLRRAGEDPRYIEMKTVEVAPGLARLEMSDNSDVYRDAEKWFDELKGKEKDAEIEKSREELKAETAERLRRAVILQRAKSDPKIANLIPGMHLTIQDIDNQAQAHRDAEKWFEDLSAEEKAAEIEKAGTDDLLINRVLPKYNVFKESDILDKAVSRFGGLSDNEKDAEIAKIRKEEKSKLFAQSSFKKVLNSDIELPERSFRTKSVKFVHKVIGQIMKASALVTKTALIGSGAVLLGKILAGFTIGGAVLFSPGILAAALVAFVAIAVSFAIKPLLNKINYELQVKGINSELNKYASTGDTRYFKGALLSFVNKTLSGIIQISGIGAIALLAFAFVFGAPALVTAALIGGLTALGAAAFLILFNAAFKTVPRSFKGIKNIKIPANPQENKTRVILGAFVTGLIGLSAAVLFPAAGIAAVIAGIAAIGMFLLTQSGIFRRLLGDSSAVQTKTIFGYGLGTLATIIPVLVLAKFGIITLSALGVALGALFPMMIVMAMIGLGVYFANTRYINKPLDSMKKPNMAANFFKIFAPLSVILASVIFAVLKGSAVVAALAAFVSPVSWGIGLGIAVIFVGLLYWEKSRPFAKVLLAALGFAIPLSGAVAQVQGHEQQAIMDIISRTMGMGTRGETTEDASSIKSSYDEAMEISSQASSAKSSSEVDESVNALLGLSGNIKSQIEFLEARESGLDDNDAEAKSEIEEQIKDAREKQSAVFQMAVEAQMRLNNMRAYLTEEELKIEQAESILKGSANALARVLGIQFNPVDAAAELSKVTTNLLNFSQSKIVELREDQIITPMSIIAQFLSAETGKPYKGYETGIAGLYESLLNDGDSVVLYQRGIGDNYGRFISLTAANGNIMIQDGNLNTTVERNKLSEYLNDTYGWTRGAVLSSKELNSNTSSYPIDTDTMKKIEGAEYIQYQGNLEQLRIKMFESVIPLMYFNNNEFYLSQLLREYNNDINAILNTVLIPEAEKNRAAGTPTTSFGTTAQVRPGAQAGPSQTPAGAAADNIPGRGGMTGTNILYDRVNLTNVTMEVQRLIERYPHLRNSTALAEVLVQQAASDGSMSLRTLQTLQRTNNFLYTMRRGMSMLDMLDAQGGYNIKGFLSDMPIVSVLGMIEQSLALAEQDGIRRVKLEFQNQLGYQTGGHAIDPRYALMPKEDRDIKYQLSQYDNNPARTFDHLMFPFIFAQNGLGQYLPANYELSPKLRETIMKDYDEKIHDSPDAWGQHIFKKYGRDILIDALTQYADRSADTTRRVTSLDFIELSRLLVKMPDLYYRTISGTDLWLNQSGELGRSETTRRSIYIPFVTPIIDETGDMQKLIKKIQHMSGGYSSADVANIVRGLTDEGLPKELGMYSSIDENTVIEIVQDITPWTALDHAANKQFKTAAVSKSVTDGIRRLERDSIGGIADSAQWAGDMLEKYKADIIIDTLKQKIAETKKDKKLLSSPEFYNDLQNLVDQFNSSKDSLKILKADDADRVIASANALIEKKETEIGKVELTELKNLIKRNLKSKSGYLPSDDEVLRQALRKNNNNVYKTFQQLLYENLFLEPAMMADGNVVGMSWADVKTGQEIEWLDKPEKVLEWNNGWTAADSPEAVTYNKIIKEMADALKKGNFIPQDYVMSREADFSIRYDFSTYAYSGDLDLRMDRMFEKYKIWILQDALKQEFARSEAEGREPDAYTVEMLLDNISLMADSFYAQQNKTDLVGQIRNGVFNVSSSDHVVVPETLVKDVLSILGMPADFKLDGKLKSAMIQYYQDNKNALDISGSYAWIEALIARYQGDIILNAFIQYKKENSVGFKDIAKMILGLGADIFGFNKNIKDFSIRATAGFTGSSPAVQLASRITSINYESRGETLMQWYAAPGSLNFYTKDDADSALKWISANEKKLILKDLRARAKREFGVIKLYDHVEEAMLADYGYVFAADKQQWLDETWQRFQKDIYLSVLEERVNVLQSDRALQNLGRNLSRSAARRELARLDKAFADIEEMYAYVNSIPGAADAYSSENTRKVLEAAENLLQEQKFSVLSALAGSELSALKDLMNQNLAGLRRFYLSDGELLLELKAANYDASKAYESVSVKVRNAAQINGVLNKIEQNYALSPETKSRIAGYFKNAEGEVSEEWMSRIAAAMILAETSEADSAKVQKLYEVLSLSAVSPAVSASEQNADAVRRVLGEIRLYMPSNYAMPSWAQSRAARYYEDALSLGLGDLAGNMTVLTVLSDILQQEISDGGEHVNRLQENLNLAAGSLNAAAARQGSRTAAEEIINPNALIADVHGILSIYLSDQYKMSDKIKNAIIDDFLENKTLNLTKEQWIERFLERHQRDILVDALEQYRDGKIVKFSEYFPVIAMTVAGYLPYGWGRLIRTAGEAANLLTSRQGQEPLVQRLMNKIDQSGYSSYDPVKNDLIRALQQEIGALTVKDVSTENKIMNWINKNERKIIETHLKEMIQAEFGDSVKLSKNLTNKILEGYVYNPDQSKREWLANIRINYAKEIALEVLQQRIKELRNNKFEYDLGIDSDPDSLNNRPELRRLIHDERMLFQMAKLTRELDALYDGDSKPSAVSDALSGAESVRNRFITKNPAREGNITLTEQDILREEMRLSVSQSETVKEFTDKVLEKLKDLLPAGYEMSSYARTLISKYFAADSNSEKYLAMEMSVLAIVTEAVNAELKKSNPDTSLINGLVNMANLSVKELEYIAQAKTNGRAYNVSRQETPIDMPDVFTVPINGDESANAVLDGIISREIENGRLPADYRITDTMRSELSKYISDSFSGFEDFSYKAGVSANIISMLRKETLNTGAANYPAMSKIVSALSEALGNLKAAAADVGSIDGKTALKSQLEIENIEYVQSAIAEMYTALAAAEQKVARDFYQVNSNLSRAMGSYYEFMNITQYLYDLQALLAAQKEIAGLREQLAAAEQEIVSVKARLENERTFIASDDDARLKLMQLFPEVYKFMNDAGLSVNGLDAAVAGETKPAQTEAPLASAQTVVEKATDEERNAAVDSVVAALKDFLPADYTGPLSRAVLRSRIIRDYETSRGVISFNREQWVRDAVKKFGPGIFSDALQQEIRKPDTGRDMFEVEKLVSVLENIYMRDDVTVTDADRRILEDGKSIVIYSAESQTGQAFIDNVLKRVDGLPAGFTMSKALQTAIRKQYIADYLAQWEIQFNNNATVSVDLQGWDSHAADKFREDIMLDVLTQELGKENPDKDTLQALVNYFETSRRMLGYFNEETRTIAVKYANERISGKREELTEERISASKARAQSIISSDMGSIDQLFAPKVSRFTQVKNKALEYFEPMASLSVGYTYKYGSVEVMGLLKGDRIWYNVGARFDMKKLYEDFIKPKKAAAAETEREESSRSRRSDAQIRAAADAAFDRALNALAEYLPEDFVLSDEMKAAVKNSIYEELKETLGKRGAVSAAEQETSEKAAAETDTGEQAAAADETEETAPSLQVSAAVDAAVDAVAPERLRSANRRARTGISNEELETLANGIAARHILNAACEHEMSKVNNDDSNLLGIEKIFRGYAAIYNYLTDEGKKAVDGKIDEVISKLEKIGISDDKLENLRQAFSSVQTTASEKIFKASSSITIEDLLSYIINNSENLRLYNLWHGVNLENLSPEEQFAKISQLMRLGTNNPISAAEAIEIFDAHVALYKAITGNTAYTNQFKERFQNVDIESPQGMEALSVLLFDANGNLRTTDLALSELDTASRMAELLAVIMKNKDLYKQWYGVDLDSIGDKYTEISRLMHLDTNGDGKVDKELTASDAAAVFERYVSLYNAIKGNSAYSALFQTSFSCDITSAAALQGLTALLFNSEGNLRSEAVILEGLNMSAAVTQFENDLSNNSFTIIEKGVKTIDGKETLYYVIRKNGSSTNMEVYPFDVNEAFVADVGKLNALYNEIIALEAMGYSITVKADRNNYLVYTLRKGGKSVDVYPVDGGNQIVNADSMNNIFNQSDNVDAAEKALKEYFGEDNVKKVVDGSVLYYEVSKYGINGKIYPFDEYGYNFDINSVKEIFEDGNSLKNNGYTIVDNEVKVEKNASGKYIVYYQVFKVVAGTAISTKVYPYNVNGNHNFDISDFNKMYDVAELLNQNGYAIEGNTIKTELKNGNYIAYYEVSKNTVTKMKVYPFDSKGNYQFN
ncbi:MAG: DEAD/DEAH box helicase family protein, partial [Endomicrobia bacterium]|nr:DEAD/DEAH box helicase family protein [Endomicrobiia bacterium]